ncbi:hypothetical protein GI584_10740 [Gracilibacillus salitolerans]|uniref:Transglutaminase-like domain-containing protein n=1 Tax=Gracilibacillus salitolerans TaxID=2663022 RepID=A0A5Q2TIF4_9BACI|nr:transglutaminase domain-containing protein [Gracilibacillus salitolerans]QGH34475.1 hypothetical protein GI584_10740 [Gracilibacillus salitolerans]
MFGYIPEFKNYYLKLLELTKEYKPQTGGATANFQYQEFSNENLRKLRTKYDLDAIAGTGSEIDQILKLIAWVHKRLTHGSMSHHEVNHALHILELADQEEISANCYVIATVLNEVLLSMGYKSRRVQCFPYDAYDLDSHVVNIVYISELNKWICVDASWNRFVTDENGNLLDLQEFRNRLSKNEKILVNGKSDTQTEESSFYLGYMSKNLFWFLCPAISEYNFDAERSIQPFYALYPNYYTPLKQLGSYNKIIIPTNDPAEFWK